MPARPNAPDMVRVWDWPLRAFHWTLAFFVLDLVLVSWIFRTGYRLKT